nr:hypothetical protein [Mycoplasmopsis bovis]
MKIEKTINCWVHKTEMFKELINNKDVEQLKKKIDELNDCIQ